MPTKPLNGCKTASNAELRMTQLRLDKVAIGVAPVIKSSDTLAAKEFIIIASANAAGLKIF